jgi:hypothetical protein
MFARQFFGNPYQPFNAGLSPFFGGAASSGITPQFGGYNPFVPFQAALPNIPYGFHHPAVSQFGGYGINPQQFAQSSGITPGPISPLQGLTPTINPLLVQQLATLNPALLSQLAPQVWSGSFGLQTNPGLLNPFFQPIGGEASLYANSPFISPLGLGNGGQGVTPFSASSNQFGPFGQGVPGAAFTQSPVQSWGSPYTAQDPLSSALLAQQLNPLAQQKLPIRPLTALQQSDPYQIGLPGVTSSITNPLIDPYAALAQSQLLSQSVINPFQQMARTYPMTNWIGSPYALGQTPPIGQMGALCNF